MPFVKRDDDDDDSSGLVGKLRGAIVGVVVTLVLLIVFGIAAFVYWRHRRLKKRRRRDRQQRQNLLDEDAPHDDMDAPKPSPFSSSPTMPYNVQELHNAPKRPRNVHPPALTPGRSPSFFSTVARHGSTAAPRRTSTDAEKHQSPLAIVNQTADAEPSYMQDIVLGGSSSHRALETDYSSSSDAANIASGRIDKGKQPADAPPPVPPKLDLPYPAPGSSSMQAGRRSLPAPPTAWGSSSSRMSGPARSASAGDSGTISSFNHSGAEDMAEEQAPVSWTHEPPDYKSAWEGRA